MNRVLIHMAVPDAKRALAGTMTGLSGVPQEHSVELHAIQGGPSASWDTTNSYSGTWWGASQALAPEIAQPMFASGYTLGTEGWFAAYWEGTNTLVPNGTNLNPHPDTADFEAFLAAAGLERVVQGV